MRPSSDEREGRISLGHMQWVLLTDAAILTDPAAAVGADTASTGGTTATTGTLPLLLTEVVELGVVPPDVLVGSVVAPTAHGELDPHRLRKTSLLQGGLELGAKSTHSVPLPEATSLVSEDIGHQILFQFIQFHRHRILLRTKNGLSPRGINQTT
jgi:hypothetical protein